MSKSTDSGDTLDLSLIRNIPSTKRTETVLVAPNKTVQKIWQKWYPGMKVFLRADHKGYPAPKAYKDYLESLG
jgi:hypothetical protein